MNAAKNVLFNLNTIESIMLTSTIFVNLAGIMLLSGQFENLEPEDEFQRDIITYTIILVISTSFFILFCSLIREVHLARHLSKNMARAKWRAIIRKQIAVNKKKRAAAKRFQNTVYDLMRKHNVGKMNHESYLKPNETERRESLSSAMKVRLYDVFVLLLFHIFIHKTTLEVFISSHRLIQTAHFNICPVCDPSYRNPSF
jgi:hypothetical protein